MAEGESDREYTDRRFEELKKIVSDGQKFLGEAVMIHTKHVDERLEEMDKLKERMPEYEEALGKIADHAICKATGGVEGIIKELGERTEKIVTGACDKATREVADSVALIKERLVDEAKAEVYESMSIYKEKVQKSLGRRRTQTLAISASILIGTAALSIYTAKRAREVADTAEKVAKTQAYEIRKSLDNEINSRKELDTQFLNYKTENDKKVAEYNAQVQAQAIENSKTAGRLLTLEERTEKVEKDNSAKVDSKKYAEDYKILKGLVEANGLSIEKLDQWAYDSKEREVSSMKEAYKDSQRITSLEEQLRSKRFGNPGEIEIGREYWKSLFNPNKK